MIFRILNAMSQSNPVVSIARRRLPDQMIDKEEYRGIAKASKMFLQPNCRQSFLEYGKLIRENNASQISGRESSKFIVSSVPSVIIGW